MVFHVTLKFAKTQFFDKNVACDIGPNCLEEFLVIRFICGMFEYREILWQF
jgi:hypothetical protein